MKQINDPLVSVVTPSYNAVSFIRETIESVLSQCYPAVEHIIIDGGSTDGTVDVLRQYPHLTWVSESDRGQSDALNKGFTRARGAIIGWLNADDTYQPAAIRTAVSYLQEHPNTAGVYSDCPYIDEQGEQLTIAKARDFDVRTLLLENYIPQPTVFLRRSTIQDVGLLDDSLHYCMDWEYWLRIGIRHRLERIPGAGLANFRFCGGTKSHDKAPEFDMEYLRILRGLFAEPPYRYLSPYWRWRAIRLAWSRHYMTRTFAARQGFDRAEVRHALPRGILNNPAWLANRGVWSTAAWAIVGISRES